MKPQINFLSPEEQERIHQAALWLLNNVGMQMPSQEALDIMRNAGARIESKDTVKIPAELVKDAVEKAPKREGFVLYGREEKYDIHFDKDTPALGAMIEATHVIDLETKEHRLCTNQDVADMVRLMDALDNINIPAPLATPQDVPKDVVDWYALASTLKNTSKHNMGPATGAQFVKDAVKMASLAVGGEEKFRARPYLSFWILTRCPFQIDRLSVEALIELSRQKLPIILSSGPILGVTCPVTLAGAVAQVHAEILAGLVLSQLVQPGTQVIYTCNPRGMDFKTANVAMSSPEFGILKGASAQMGHYLGLPVMTYALLRDAKVLDAQAGFETGIIGLVSALTSDVVSGMQFDMDCLMDFADLVFCNEAMGALKRMARDFSVDDNTLALDVMKEVGHGGDFLSNTHTLQNFRNEIWVPRLMERRAWPQWDKDGQKDIEQRAREKAREILASHQPERLSPEVEAEIDQIVSEAKIDYTQKF